MKLRAFAILAALAVPAVASATPNDPPSSLPSANSPSSNPSNPSPMNPSPSSADPSSPSNHNNPTAIPDKSPTMPSDKATPTTPTNDGSKTAKLDDADTKIVAHLHHVNQMEIQAGQLAEKSGSTHVKDYAKTLVSDHQSADKDLTAFAKAHKLMTIPADKAATDADRQDEKDMTTAMAHLKTLKGADFDKEFLNMMVSGHDKELTKVDVAISGASDPDLKSLLQSVKPVLQRHADQARDLQKSPQASANDQTKQLPSAKKP